MKYLRPLVLALLLVSLPAAGQQPRVSNARMETRALAGALEKEFAALVAAQSEAAWIGYAAPLVDRRHSMCCYSSDSCCSGCGLEREKRSEVFGSSEPVRLEGPAYLLVLFRVEQAAVTRIRQYSEDCPLDAGGLPFVWLTGVPPGQSVALLASFARQAGSDERDTKRLGESALAAIALHGDASADAAMEQFVAAGQPERLRERAAFWLGVARGHRGYEVLRRMLENDPSEHVRDKAVFALSQSREPEAVNAMIQAAKGDRSAHVRGQALFWLAQKAGRKAAGAISEAIESDPDTEVKKRAVFALSQLPKDEGVPLLIQVARTNKNPVARKQAIFWLGQSRDPRALAFFEEVLK